MVARLFQTLGWVLAAGLLLPGIALAQLDLRIVSVDYRQHFNPGESVTFTIVVQNNESTAQFAEVDITLTNLSSRVETTLVPVLISNDSGGNIAPGNRRTLTGTYQVSSNPNLGPTASGPGLGLYTVSFPLFDGNGDRADQVLGKFPLHVGTEMERIRVFPEIIHLGPLPPGRSMYPVPIEVRWDFFRFNRLRSDQPFTIRIYTDNAARFSGIPGALHRLSPAGLVSADGRYVIPLKIWNLNVGPDIQQTGWDAALAGPPPVEEDVFWRGPSLLEGGRNFDAASWVRVPDWVDMTAEPSSWRRLIGQDPFDNRFAADSNVTGDFTLANPFTFYLATDAGPAAVEGNYSTDLIVELWNP